MPSAFFNPQIPQITRITLILMKDDTKSIGFIIPLATPGLATG